MYNISSAQRAISTVHSIIILFPAHLDDEVCTYGAECTIVSRGSSRCTGSSALVRVVQPCTEKSPLDRGDEQHQLAASQPARHRGGQCYWQRALPSSPKVSIAAD